MLQRECKDGPGPQPGPFHCLSNSGLPVPPPFPHFQQHQACSPTLLFPSTEGGRVGEVCSTCLGICLGTDCTKVAKERIHMFYVFLYVSRCRVQVLKTQWKQGVTTFDPSGSSCYSVEVELEDWNLSIQTCIHFSFRSFFVYLTISMCTFSQSGSFGPIGNLSE